MIAYSTSEAARMLGITQAALSKYIKAGKVPAPKKVTIGRLTIHSWTEAQVDKLRKLLPTIANGRKTRHQTDPRKPKFRTKRRRK
jgi:predicted transcriptional regulator